MGHYGVRRRSVVERGEGHVLVTPLPLCHVFAPVVVTDLRESSESSAFTLLESGTTEKVLDHVVPLVAVDAV